MLKKTLPLGSSIRLVKIAPGKNARFWDDCRAGGYICVGWDEVGNLLNFNSKDDLKAAFSHRCSYSPAWKADELWTLRELRPGDRIIANNGLSKVVGVGTVKRPGYVWMPARRREGYCHTVKVHWDRTSWGGRDYKKISRQPWNNTVASVSRDLFEHVSGSEVPKELVITEKATMEQREVLARLVRQRQGQPRFRKALIQAYNCRCAISRCGVEAALEAAHIGPKRTAVPCNGILLRSDLHLLFDLRMLTVDPVTLLVHVKSTLVGSEYWKFNKKKIRVPENSAWRPGRKLLEGRYRLYMSG